MKARNPSTGNLETVYVKALDSMPVGTEVDFDGTSADIPTGWEQVDNVIWTNPNKYSSFSAQTIQADLTKYDYIEILYFSEVSVNNWSYEMSTGKLPIINNTSTILGGYVMIKGADSAPQYFGREAIIKTTGIQFQTGHNFNGSSYSDRNESGVPIMIIGYKS